MPSIPLKPEYGPTLGRLLAPRWRSSSKLVRTAVIAVAVGLLAVLIGAALTLVNSTYSQAGPTPFSFNYRDVYRVPPGPGNYVQVRAPATGRLRYSFAVGPLQLPPYSGSLSGELPIYASSYVDSLRRRDASFVLRGESKTRVNTVPAYAIAYTTTIAGSTYYGRDILLLPERVGARLGVRIAMLSAPHSDPHVTSPILVGTTGVLELPLETFTIG
jgi:hypothetical protein